MGDVVAFGVIVTLQREKEVLFTTPIDSGEDATLFAIQMRIVESNAVRQDLTQMPRGLGRIARGEIGERLSGTRHRQSS